MDAAVSAVIADHHAVILGRRSDNEWGESLAGMQYPTLFRVHQRCREVCSAVHTAGEVCD